MGHGESVAFVLGATTAVGPCMLPRYLLITGYIADSRGWTVSTAVFTGVICGAMLVAAFGLSLSQFARASHIVYAVIAAALLVSGCFALHDRECDRRYGAKSVVGISLGGAFLCGVSAALVPSPCCAPIVVALGILGGTSPFPLIAFIIGHAVPIIAFGSCGIAVRRRVARWQKPMGTVNAAVALGIGGYYALLA